MALSGQAVGMYERCADDDAGEGYNRKVSHSLPSCRIKESSSADLAPRSPRPIRRRPAQQRKSDVRGLIEKPSAN